MPSHCVVPVCTGNGGHGFPRDTKLRKKWIHAIRRKNFNPTSFSKVCHEHFISSQYITDRKGKPSGSKIWKLKTGEVPCKFAWTEKPKSASARSTRALNRASIKNWDGEPAVTISEGKSSDIMEHVPEISVSDDRPMELSHTLHNENNGKKSSDIMEHCPESSDPSASDDGLMELSITLSTESENVNIEIMCISDENNLDCVTEEVVIDRIESSSEPLDLALHSVICTGNRAVTRSTQTIHHNPFSIERFKNDAVAIHYYTGLETYEKFMFVLKTLGNDAYNLNYKSGTVTLLTIPDQFFLTLIKLRRNMPDFELSRSFDVSKNTVRNVWLTWVNFMYLQWKEVQTFPSKDLVQYYMPSGFRRDFPSTRVIIDGMECPVVKPSHPVAQQATFSQYKNRNTTKVLVGTTPGGLTAYVSESYGGSATDRQITERSELLNLIEQGDSIMADKGFNVQDLFATKGAAINLPTFVKNKNQLSNKEVVKDRKIASKRVHVERIIGLGKTYKILTLPMTRTATELSGRIIFTVFMLCNFRRCIVGEDA